MQTTNFAQLHVILEGQCCIEYGKQNHSLNQGDVILFPFGQAHSLKDKPSSKTMEGKTVLEAIQNNRSPFGRGAESTHMLCGHFEFDKSLQHPILNELPNYIHVSSIEQQFPGWLDMAAKILVTESTSTSPGSSVVCKSLAEVMFFQVLQAYLSDANVSIGFFAAIQDRRINQALNIMHTQYSSNLSLEGIAKSVGLSRSSLTERYKRLLGKAPMTYLTQWRMLQAKELLQHPHLNLESIAQQLSYGSVAAFSRAFQREFGKYPSAFRDQHTEFRSP